MCNDTLEILRIKDKNIKFVSQDIDVLVKGKKSTVVNAVLTYKPSACPYTILYLITEQSRVLTIKLN